MRSIAALATITIVCASLPLYVMAHGTADALPPFWMGVRQMVTAPLPIIATVGLGALVAFESAGATWSAICAAGLAAFLFATANPAALVGAPSLVVIAITGIALMSGWSPPWWLSLLFGLATGAVAATASNHGVPRWDAA